jgi:hypothetical protein
MTPPSPFDMGGMRPPNGTLTAITVQYNVTYTFTPWGWRTVDVSVSNATFHPSTPVNETGGGLVSMTEPIRNSDMASNSGLWWWPKKTDEAKPIFGTVKETPEAPTGFDEPPLFPHASFQ